MLDLTAKRLLTGVVACCLALVLVLGVVGGALAPAPEASQGGALIGRTAFAYLGGLRRFGAAVLWNRIDPQFHTYYEGRSLGDMTFMLPTLRLIQSLDPQFQQTYYVGSWIVARHGDIPTGLDIARDGLRANPRAGLMYTNLMEVLVYDGLQHGDADKHLAEEAKLAEAALEPAIVWDSESDRFESYVVIADVLERAGRREQERAVRSELERMRAGGLVTNVEKELQEDAGGKGP